MRILLSIAVLLAFVPGSHAALVREDGSPVAPRYQRWLDRSKVQAPPATITLHEAPCPSHPETSCARTPGLEIWIHPFHRMNPGTLYHELGHQFDYGMRMEDRGWFLHEFFGPGRTWLNPRGIGMPSEHFANLYAHCAMFGVNTTDLTNGRVRVAGHGERFIPIAKYQSACRYLKYNMQYVGQDESKYPEQR